MERSTTRTGVAVIAILAAVLLAGLPLAVWMDLRNLSERTLRRQAGDLNTVITNIRGFYSEDVVGRVIAARGRAIPTDNYHAIAGGIPIPATFSLQLARVVDEKQAQIEYRFVSDYPFKHRAPHPLDDVERAALVALRADARQQITVVNWTGFHDRVRLITPVIMGASCVACHNSDPDSPKHDWRVGDVRGIQELSFTVPLATGLFSFRYLLIYFACAAILCWAVIALQRRQAGTIRRINGELADSNAFLSSISTTVSHYISPQIYKSIFSGRSDGTIHTERKKLTIFFSDIKDFTSTTERLQPEELTALLNEYFTEMSAIALRHGGTIDKFLGDAMLVFFGDPESKGVSEDACSCLRMAVEMQRRLVELNFNWRSRGVEQPFRVRMGINTGYCNVGNFGSADRMDYTIIGAEANLASRLESIADPGTIVVSYETYALVRDIAFARPLAPMVMKGIAREVIPYVIEELVDSVAGEPHVFSAHANGLDLYLNLALIGEEETEQLREVLDRAAKALDRNGVRGRTTAQRHGVNGSNNGGVRSETSPTER